MTLGVFADVPSLLDNVGDEAVAAVLKRFSSIDLVDSLLKLDCQSNAGILEALFLCYHAHEKSEQALCDSSGKVLCDHEVAQQVGHGRFDANFVSGVFDFLTSGEKGRGTLKMCTEIFEQDSKSPAPVRNTVEVQASLTRLIVSLLLLYLLLLLIVFIFTLFNSL